MLCSPRVDCVVVVVVAVTVGVVVVVTVVVVVVVVVYVECNHAISRTKLDGERQTVHL